MEYICEVVIVVAEGGISQGCKYCRRIYLRGKFAVGLVINAVRYLVKTDEPVVCCGEEKSSFKVFERDDEAEAEKVRVMAILDRDRSTENLKLLGIASNLAYSFGPEN